MNIIKYSILLIAVLFISSCSKDETGTSGIGNDEYKEATVSQTGFFPGDEVTRATLSYGSKGLTISWNIDDRFGIFPTSENNTASEQSSMQPFTCYSVDNDPQNASINSDNKDFQFQANYGYTAYFATTIDQELEHNNIGFDFGNQSQKGYVNMGAYYKATGNRYDNPTYKASETAACQHLGDVDILISPEMKKSDTDKRMFFPMRHIGAIARFFLLTPAKKLKIKELRLISNNNIFYEKGKVTLASHRYDASKVPAQAPITVTDGFDYNNDIYNYGVCLPQFKNPQMTADEASKTNCLVLKFGENGNGIDNLYDSDTRYGNYFMAYLMMYPITTSDADNVYIYVTTEDLETNKPLYFRTKRLANKIMFSGYVYQWTETTTEDTPIELTATLQTWQEVASGAIDTNLEK